MVGKETLYINVFFKIDKLFIYHSLLLHIFILMFINTYMLAPPPITFINLLLSYSTFFRGNLLI